MCPNYNCAICRWCDEQNPEDCYYNYYDWYQDEPKEEEEAQ